MARQRESKYKFTYRRTNKLTPDTIKKLEEAANFRLSIRESCAYAEIHHDTYYEWMKKVKGLADRLADLRAHPLIKAKRRIVSQIDLDTNVAFRYLEKEKPEEYGEKLKLEHTGSVMQDDGLMHAEDEALRKEFRDRLKANIQKRAIEKSNENRNKAVA